MLKIKYFESFKNGNPFIVIISDRDGLHAAYLFFQSENGAYLDDSRITEIADISPLSRERLYLNQTECRAISEHFKNLYLLNEARHAYFDTQALGDKIEVIISYGEYKDLF